MSAMVNFATLNCILIISIFVYDYRGVNKSVFVLLSRTQAGPGRTVKQEQEYILI